MDFNKTDLLNNILIINNDDGETICIPEEECTVEEAKLFEEFRTIYPNGKPIPKVELQEHILTETELLKQQIGNLETYILQKELQESSK